MLRVRLLYQSENPRSWSRAIAPTRILSQRSLPIFCQVASEMNTATHYDITMLVDWSPQIPYVAPNYGATIWDVPEDIEQHLTDPAYLAYFHAVPTVSVPNRHLLQVVRGLSHKTIVLPTWLDHGSLSQETVQPSQAIACFSPFSETIASLVREWCIAHNYLLVTNDHILARSVGNAMVVENSYPSYRHALKACKALLCPATPHRTGDGFWSREAAYLGIPVLASPNYPAEHNYITICHNDADWIKHLNTLADKRLNLQEKMAQSRAIGDTWSIHSQIERTWMHAWKQLAT